MHGRSTPLLDAVFDVGVDALAARVGIGLMGVVGFPLYYIVWKYLMPQPHESLTLRLCLAALFLPMFLPEHHLRSAGRYWVWYFHLTLGAALPFFFTYMALMNNTVQWALSFVAALLLLQAVVLARTGDCRTTPTRSRTNSWSETGRSFSSPS